LDSASAHAGDFACPSHTVHILRSASHEAADAAPGHQGLRPSGRGRQLRTAGRPCRARERRRTAMAVVTIRQLLDSGVHFGHQTRRWNPKVKRFILTERSGIHIIDLQQSLAYIDKAYEFVKETVAH